MGTFDTIQQVLIGNAAGIITAWVVARVLFKLYVDKDVKFISAMNSRIDDLQRHHELCQKQNAFLNEEVFKLKSDLVRTLAGVRKNG